MRLPSLASLGSLLGIAWFGLVAAPFACSSSSFQVAAPSGDAGDLDSGAADVDPGGGGDAGGGDGGAPCAYPPCLCADPLYRCGADCVDRSSDVDHCGSCADKCSAAPTAKRTCVAGRCGFQCRLGFHACGSDCAPDDSTAACGAACAVCPSPPNASPTCAGGKCGATCHAGFADCHPSTPGCETDLSAPDNCGACGVKCTGAAAKCAQTTPGTYACIDICPVGTLECSGACVDVTKSVSNCGGCGVTCTAPTNATATCGPTGCGYKCDSSYHACSAACVSNGAVATCGPSCSPCPVPANAAAATCDGTKCGFTCKAGFADCNGDPSNGCEADLNGDPAHCGGCTTACAAPTGGSASCTGGTCGFSCQAGWLKLGDRCAVYGGTFEPFTTSGGVTCGSCAGSNPYGNCVACPSGFSEQDVPTPLDLCGGARLSLCYAPTPPTLPPTFTPPDFAGMFVTRESCSKGCEVHNPYDSGGDGCDCPPGSTALRMPLHFRTTACGGSSAEGQLVFCQGTGAPVTFSGAYMTDFGGGGCWSDSPCACPPGSKTVAKYPMMAIPPGSDSPRPASVVICGP